MGKSKDRIRVNFCGNNAEDVTGSQTYIDCGQSKKKILIECGLVQSNQSTLKEYQINNRKFDFKAKELDFVFVGHLHIDHSGLLPLLMKRGSKARIIAPSGFKNIYKEMALDSAKIMERNSLELTKKFKKDYPPIYTSENVYETLQYIEEYERDIKYKLDENIEFMFQSSNHIINACQIILWIKNGNITKKIGITSDLGNISNPQYYVDDFKPIENCNLLIGETTYCNKKRSTNKKDREKDLEKIKTVVYNTCKENKGSVLFPTFSLQRTQNIITYLYQLFKDEPNFDIPIYVSSPLAVRITKMFSQELKDENQKKLFEDVLSWKNLKFIKDFAELSEVLIKEDPAVFCSSAGMLNAGHSVYIASQLLPKAKNQIVFVGYSSEGSLAWKIKQKKTKTINIDGIPVPSRCGVTNLSSMSSHMQYEDLLWYYSSYNFDKIALVHGNFKDKCEFAKVLQSEISKKNRTGKVISVNKSTEILL